MNRETQGFVLLLLGGAVLREGLTDVSLRYVKAGLRPLLVAAGIVLVIAALATFWYELRANRERRREAHDEHDDGSSGGAAHHEPRIAWLMVVPVFVLILVVPPPLGSYAANRAGTALQPGLAVGTAPAGDPASMSLVDYATLAAFYHGGTLGSRRVTITGFITVGPHGTPYLTRMILTCCAADAQPVKVGLTGQVPPDLRPDVWLAVTGTYTNKLLKDDVNSGPIPYIQVTRTTPVPAPHDPYGT